MNYGRINIAIDDNLLRKARQPTELSTNRESVNKALELLVRSEPRKSILKYLRARYLERRFEAVTEESRVIVSPDS